jgi:hypothetical protein
VEPVHFLQPVSPVPGLSLVITDIFWNYSESCCPQHFWISSHSWLATRFRPVIFSCPTLCPRSSICPGLPCSSRLCTGTTATSATLPFLGFFCRHPLAASRYHCPWSLALAVSVRGTARSSAVLLFFVPSLFPSSPWFPTGTEITANPAKPNPSHSSTPAIKTPIRTHLLLVTNLTQTEKDVPAHTRTYAHVHVRLTHWRAEYFQFVVASTCHGRLQYVPCSASYLFQLVPVTLLIDL